MEYPKKVQLLEIGPRDGFQSIQEWIPTELKQEMVDRLVDSGCNYIQVTSFVHPKAIPQMKDAAAVARYALEHHPNVRFTALAPNKHGAKAAYEAGLREISCVISVSPGHNRANVNRTLDESFEELADICQTLPDAKINLECATAFGCPFDGEVQIQQVVDFVGRGWEIGIRTFELCDTIGVANPVQVERTIQSLRKAYPQAEFGIHIHDTRNMGMTNTLMAVQNGITRVAATVGGLGGCPFAPGASGNTASEDLVNMFRRMGIETGVNFEKLLETARYLRDQVPGNYSGHNMNVIAPPCVMN